MKKCTQALCAAVTEWRRNPTPENSAEIDEKVRQYRKATRVKLQPALAALLVALSTTAAAAQSRTYYGPSGQYQGQSFTNGNSTTFYGSSGQYEGQAFRNGNSTTFYGPSGQYQGQTFTTPSPFNSNRGFGFGQR